MSWSASVAEASATRPRPIGRCQQSPLYSAANAGVAQVVEQLIRNQQVGGSSPLAGTM